MTKCHFQTELNATLTLPKKEEVGGEASCAVKRSGENGPEAPRPQSRVAGGPRDWRGRVSLEVGGQ